MNACPQCRIFIEGFAALLFVYTGRNAPVAGYRHPLPSLYDTLQAG